MTSGDYGPQPISTWGTATTGYIGSLDATNISAGTGSVSITSGSTLTAYYLHLGARGDGLDGHDKPGWGRFATDHWQQRERISLCRHNRHGIVNIGAVTTPGALLSTNGCLIGFNGPSAKRLLISSSGTVTANGALVELDIIRDPILVLAAPATDG